MFAKFLIVVLMQLTAGTHIEGGFDCYAENGAKPCIESAWENREPVDYSKMND